MRIFFGWSSIKVRSFTLSELGIMKQSEPDLEFEVRQAYFHLCGVPFFGLGKRWVMRKGSSMYEMPLEIQTLAKSTLTGIRTPLYTFIGLLVIAGLCIYFSAVNLYDDYRSHKITVNDYKEKVTELSAKVQHLTTNDFIALAERERSYPNSLYLKVENIKGDDIMVTPVACEKDDPMKVEDAYTRHAGTLPKVKVSYKKLLVAYPKVWDSANNGAWPRQAANLLNDDKFYIVTNVVRRFMPVVKVSYANFETNNIAIRCRNEGYTGTIIEMKNVVGNIDWSEIINTEFPGGQSEAGSYYHLTGKGIASGQPYKFIMTLKDTTGHLHKYEIEGPGSYKVSVREL